MHKVFVVVPINKAAGNMAFLCKKFYASVITRELGLNNNSSTDTYKWLICKKYNRTEN